MQFKTWDLQYSSRAKTSANRAEPWAAAEGEEGKKVKSFMMGGVCQ